MTLVCSEPVHQRESLSKRAAIAAEWGAVTVLFSLLTLWYTGPLWRHPESYVVDPLDPVHNISVSWWLSRLWLSGHLRGMWDLPPYFYPARHTLALDDPQLGTTLLGLPVFAATHSAVAAYNAVVLLTLPLCARGAYTLARHLTGSRGGALVAGIAWGFGAWHSGQAAHQQILSLWCLPWVLLMLHRYAETQQNRFLVGLFAFWVAQEYLCLYWAGFLFLLVLPFALVLLRVCAGLSWRITGRAVGTILLAGVAWLPGLWPFFALARHPHKALMIAQFSADLADYLPQRGSWLWGNWGSSGFGEAALSPGILVLALAAVAAWRLWRPVAETPGAPLHEKAWARIGTRMPFVLALLLILRGLMALLGVGDLLSLHMPAWLNADAVTRAGLFAVIVWANAPIRAWLRRHRVDWRSPLAAYVFLALLAIVWSCGYEVRANGVFLAPGLHGLVAWLPGMRSFRVLQRMGIFADLALSMLAAATIAEGLHKWSGRGKTLVSRTSVVLLCVLVLAENVPRVGTAFARSGPHLPPTRAVDAWLRQQPPGALVELPFYGLDAERMWYQTKHGHPTFNGYATFPPPGWLSEANTLSHPETAAAVSLLKSLEIRYVVIDNSARAHLPPSYIRLYADAQTSVYAVEQTTR